MRLEVQRVVQLAVQRAVQLAVQLALQLDTASGSGCSAFIIRLAYRSAGSPALILHRFYRSDIRAFVQQEAFFFREVRYCPTNSQVDYLANSSCREENSCERTHMRYTSHHYTHIRAPAQT